MKGSLIIILLFLGTIGVQGQTPNKFRVFAFNSDQRIEPFKITSFDTTFYADGKIETITKFPAVSSTTDKVVYQYDACGNLKNITTFLRTTRPSCWLPSSWYEDKLISAPECSIPWVKPFIQ